MHFTDYGEALPRGTVDEQDLYVFTGSVFQHNGLFHIFYTGHNPHFRAAGKPEQAVMHATSPDLITWTKDPANPILFADPERYEIHDWRDPFIFQYPDTQQFGMLLAARLKSGPGNRRGITALAVSDDLTHWQIAEPFWSPSLYFTHECPDLFRIGDWWYQVYSTFSERVITHYRMSRSLTGTWTAPVNDSFDGRAFYAAKTASDGQRHFAFGWNPTRTGDSDTGGWNWGGNLVVHEFYQQPDGSLAVKAPPEVLAQFAQPLPAQPTARMGEWMLDGATAAVDSRDGFAWCRLGALPDTACLLDTTVTFSAVTRGCGILLRADDELERYYQIRLEPGRNRVVFDRWPRPGDEPPIIERPIELPANVPLRLQVMVEGTVIVVYVGERQALNTRGYEHTGGACGLFVSEGAAVFRDCRMSAASG